jgi:hypothetical protein
VSRVQWARIVTGYVERREAYVADQVQLGEAQLAAESELEAEVVDALWPKVREPGPVPGGPAWTARRTARRRSKRAGELDMRAFEAQFAGGAS